jgi:hypothetical protein
MGVLTILELIITLLGGVSSAFKQTGLTELATSVDDAIATLQGVQGTAVTQAQLEGLRIPIAPPQQ